MKRLEPVEKKPHEICSVRLGFELSELMLKEQERIGVTRSELIRMVLEQYFEEVE